MIGGFYGTPWADWIGDFLEPSTHTTNLGSPPAAARSGWRSRCGLVTGLIGIAIAWARYARREPKFAAVAQSAGRAAGSSSTTSTTLRRGLRAAGAGHAGLWRIGLEGGSLDGGSRGVGRLIGGVSKGLRRLQTGYARNYALAIFVGAALILVYLRDPPVMAADGSDRGL